MRLRTLALFAFVAHFAGTGVAQVHFERLQEEVISSRFHEISRKNSERERILRRLFDEAGCMGPQVSEQAVKGTKIPNVICTLPGLSDHMIVVGAHFDQVESGMGAVDNWSGASLLPSLFQSLSREPRKHTFVFVGFTDEEKGMVGSRFYVKELSAENLEHIDAMVNMDSLGLNSTEIWLSHADKKLANAAAQVAHAMNLTIAAVNVDNVGSTDSESFRVKKVPSITFHSITTETLPILHSPRDQLAVVNMNHLYESYELMAAYLAFLDSNQIPRGQH